MGSALAFSPNLSLEIIAGSDGLGLQMELHQLTCTASAVDLDAEQKGIVGRVEHGLVGAVTGLTLQIDIGEQLCLH